MDNGTNLSDGGFHVWRFDWHTGENGETPRVEFYVDGELKHTSTTHVPSIASRLTIGTWFPTWAGGAASFDTQYLDVDWVKITAFGEANDRVASETYPDDGLTKCQAKADNDAGLVECRLRAQE